MDGGYDRKQRVFGMPEEDKWWRNTLTTIQILSEQHLLKGSDRVEFPSLKRKRNTTMAFN